MNGVSKRPDHGARVEVYFSRLSPEQRALVERLHSIVMNAVPDADASLKWGMPVYEHRGLLCYLRASRAHVTLGFYQQGSRLDDPHRLLEGSSRNMRHIKFGPGARLPEPSLRSLLRQGRCLERGSLVQMTRRRALPS